MAKEKENKTNAMRILDKNKINYEVNTYECDEFIDGVHIADMLGQCMIRDNSVAFLQYVFVLSLTSLPYFCRK